MQTLHKVAMQTMHNTTFTPKNYQLSNQPYQHKKGYEDLRLNQPY